MRPEASISRTPQRLRALGVVVAVLTLAAACAAHAEEGSPDAVAGGWVDGSPGAADAAHGSVAGDLTESDRADEAAVAAPTDEASVEAELDSGDSTEPGPAAGLSAGSVDDNEDFDGFLDYLRRTRDAGIPSRELDVSVRHEVEVTGSDGRPVMGEPVELVAGGEVVATVRTGADGRALVHPRAYGVEQTEGVELRVDGQAREPAQDAVRFELARAGGASAEVRLDLFFVLDATGSMSDELDRLTAAVGSVVARISELEGDPDVRLGMTVYRDEGDAFVTRTFDFTNDVASFQAALEDVSADGGGDTPEALDEALGAALEEPSWREAEEAVQMLFVVTDAPPQISRGVEAPYDGSLRRAATEGIRIHSVAASGTDDTAELVLRQLAQFAGGRFVFLSYGAGGAALGPGTDIASVDYEELPLEDLLVRLVAEELVGLTGGELVVPPPTSSTTTTHPQQNQD